MGREFQAISRALRPRRLASLLPALGTLLGGASPIAAQDAAGPSSPVAVAEARPGAPIELPSPAVLDARRARLAEAVGEGVVLIRSASLKDIEGDYPQDSDFRQDNNFLYLTGLETPDSWFMMVVGPDGEREEVLFVPTRDPAQEVWTGRRLSFEEAAAGSGIATTLPADDFVERAAILEFLPSGTAGPPALFVPMHREASDEQRLLAALFETAVETRDVEPVVAQLRLVKDDAELAALRRAIEITDAAQRAAMRALRPGMFEYELEAVIEFNFRLGGAERVGFPSIVGSGPNSVTLHYDKSRRRMEAGDLVVIDVGAEYSYYTADITRTIPVSGRFTDRQREIYELVLGAQAAAIDAVRPGATMADVERAARVYLHENGAGLCGPRSCQEYFIHGVGHWLGMDVHDVGSYATRFAPGMVLTVEPGIYLPAENLGVRIEDDVLVTESGNEILSTGSPRDPDEIEALMATGATSLLR